MKLNLSPQYMISVSDQWILLLYLSGAICQEVFGGCQSRRTRYAPSDTVPCVLENQNVTHIWLPCGVY